MTDDNIVRAAIGRIAAIGDLYDVRTDTFCGISLLKKTPPESAIGDMDNPFTNIQFTHSDTYNERFEKLDINAELKLSILCGLFTLGGSGKYLKDEKKSAKAVRSSLIYNIQTKVETLNIFNEELKNCFALDALDVKSATHVVTDVSWGANSMITMEYNNTENRDKKEIQGQLQSQLSIFSNSISSTGSGVYETNNENNEHNYKIHVFGDIMPTDEELPQTFEEALKLMKRLPKLVQSANDGKGKPLIYTMVSLSTLEKYLKVSQMADRMINQINEQSIIRFVQMFDEISAAKQELYDLYETLFSHKYCILNNIIQTVGEKRDTLDTEEASFRSNLAKILVDVRSGRSSADKLGVLFDETQNGEMSVNKIRNFINSYSHVVDKINFVDLLQGEGVTYIGADCPTSLESEKLKNVDGDIYVLFFENLKITSDNQYIADNKSHFLRMAKRNKDQDNSTQGENKKTIKTYIAVDLEMRPELRANENVNSGTRICHYRNGKYINSDVLLEYLTHNGKCLVESHNIQLSITKPNKRVRLEMRCPGSLGGFCSNADQEWCCYNCGELIDYGFDGYFYCRCGKALNDSFQYKCNDDKHGMEFLEFTKDQLTQLLANIRPMKEMNILILGETGVGKSTWINGLYNYMRFKSLADAEKSEPLYLIASSFTKFDDNYEPREIKIGDDKNESQVTGQSATQSPRTYVLDWDKTSVRLIDTPGIGDTRGGDKDKENFDGILRYIATLEKLHGICILLKPDNARLSLIFQYCIKQLLTYLHKSASDNIVFCFTHARSTNYIPGQTAPLLQSFLQENKDIRIGLSMHTMFCMDNESFKFLWERHNGIKHSDYERNNCNVSWNKSVTETHRLFKHISGLKPHTTKDTLSLNDARKVIINLTKPLADIAKNIQTNFNILKDKQNEIQRYGKSRKELLDRLYVPSVYKVPKDMDYPMTVCTTNKCTRRQTVPGTKEIETLYTTHCHDHCYLDGVEENIHPSPKLKNCLAMNGGENCRKCGCNWNVHMHISFDYVTKTKNVLDQTTQNLINSKTNDEEKVKIFINKMESEIDQWKKEQDIITDISVKFGSFLKTYAIAPYNDAFKDYFEMLIKEEREKVNAGGDPKSLEGLESMLNRYKEEIRILNKSMADNNVKPLKPNEVNDLVKTLYALPKNGKMLEDIMKVSLASKTKMMTTYTETHISSRKYANNLHPKMKPQNQSNNLSYDNDQGPSYSGSNSRDSKPW